MADLESSPEIVFTDSFVHNLRNYFWPIFGRMLCAHCSAPWPYSPALQYRRTRQPICEECIEAIPEADMQRMVARRSIVVAEHCYGEGVKNWPCQWFHKGCLEIPNGIADWHQHGENCPFQFMDTLPLPEELEHEWDHFDEDEMDTLHRMTDEDWGRLLKERRDACWRYLEIELAALEASLEAWKHKQRRCG